MKQAIIRADDLGISEGVNYGIEKSIKDGIIRTVGLMVNMDATVHGWNLIKDMDLCLGLHSNICVGKPLCDPKDVSSLCKENGELKSSKVYREAIQNGNDIVVVEEAVLEVEAQYQRFVQLTGRKPDYIEGHAVASPNFSKAMQIVSKNHDCDFFEVFSKEPAPFRKYRLHISLHSSRPDYEPLTFLINDLSKDYPENEMCMYVCHPGYVDPFILEKSSLTINRVKETHALCSKELKDWLIENDIELITYNDLKA